MPENKIDNEKSDRKETDLGIDEVRKRFKKEIEELRLRMLKIIEILQKEKQVKLVNETRDEFEKSEVKVSICRDK